MWCGAGSESENSLMPTIIHGQEPVVADDLLNSENNTDYDWYASKFKLVSTFLVIFQSGNDQIQSQVQISVDEIQTTISHWIVMGFVITRCCPFLRKYGPPLNLSFI